MSKPIEFESKEIDIFGVRFKALIWRCQYPSSSTEILELVPLDNWSLSRSASSAKEINIFKRSR
jgi:hypothetical protein